MRSALYQAATAEERRQAHRALADAAGQLGDSDRQAWHSAAAAEGPDPKVVAALELVGSRAERRGAYESALAAYERAAGLATLIPQRTALTLAAARNAWACGQTTHARELLAASRGIAEDAVLLSDIARLQGRIEVNIGSADDAHRIFTEAAHAIHDVDGARALEMAVAAAIMATYGADGGVTLAPGDIDTEVSETDSARTTCLKQMLVAMNRAAEGDWTAAVAALDLALATARRSPTSTCSATWATPPCSWVTKTLSSGSTPGALASSRGRRRDGGGLCAAAAVLRPPRRRRLGRRTRQC